MTNLNKRPQVGVSAVIIKDGSILLGVRKGSIGNGTLAIPGGAMEYGENPRDAIFREVKEETGLNINFIQPLGYINNVFTDQHWITFCFVCNIAKDTEPENIEPDKCEGWSWYKKDYLYSIYNNEPDRLFLPMQNILKEKSDDLETIFTLNSIGDL